jgi:hypothetical protein
MTEVFLNLTEVLLTLTEVFPFSFLSCEANARVKLADGARTALYHISWYLCCSVVICVVLCIVCVYNWQGLCTSKAQEIYTNPETKLVKLLFCHFICKTLYHLPDIKQSGVFIYIFAVFIDCIKSSPKYS